MNEKVTEGKTTQQPRLEGSPRRKRKHGEQAIFACDHAKLTMMVKEDNSSYFLKAYVDRKGEEYDWPVACSDCGRSIVIEK
jgi:hypothetical protein